MIYLQLINNHHKPLGRPERGGCVLSLLRFVFSFLEANPDYEDKIDYVATWLIEYDDEKYHVTIKEIGLDENGQVIVKMPDERNYGYWPDTDFKLEGFKRLGAQEIKHDEFTVSGACQCAS